MNAYPDHHHDHALRSDTTRLTRDGTGDRTGAELTLVSLLHSKRLGGNTTPSKPQDVRLHNVGLHKA